MNQPPETDRQQPPSPPWWRIKMMWLVVGSPLAVVVASVALVVVAVRGGDTPVRDPAVADKAGALAPAHQARNHAVAAGTR